MPLVQLPLQHPNVDMEQEPAGAVGPDTQDIIPYGDLLATFLPMIDEGKLLYKEHTPHDLLAELASVRAPRTSTNAVLLDSPRRALLEARFKKPKDFPRAVTKPSKFQMAPGIRDLAFTAPAVDPSLNLFNTYTAPTRASLDASLRTNMSLFEGAMAEFRLAFHGSLMTRALAKTFINVQPTLEQRSMLSHMSKAHMEAMDIAANMACMSLVQMRQCLLHLHGLVGKLSVQEQLVAGPYCGVHVFGPCFVQYQSYLLQAAQQVQVVQGTTPRSTRPRGGARGGQSMNRMSLLDAPHPQPRAAQAVRVPFQGNRAPAGRGAGRGQSKKQKRHN
jgi:hypothetical protein